MNEKGTLKSIGVKNYGSSKFEFYECADCGTLYPVSGENDLPQCNNVSIELCPRCREDSKPYQNGRGI
jgi:hypothetical protein